MAAGLTFKATSRGAVAKRLARVPARLKTATMRTMEMAVRVTEADLKAHALTGQKGSDAFWGVTGAAGNALGARTGHTRRSIATSVLGLFPAGAVGTVGSPLKQMKLHEEGGTITGKPWLRIPTAASQRPGSGTDVLAGRSARGIPGVFILRSDAGKLWLAKRTFSPGLRGVPGNKASRAAFGAAQAEHTGKTVGGLVLLYLLVRRVTVRARRPFATTLARVRPRVRALVGHMFTATVRGSD